MLDPCSAALSTSISQQYRLLSWSIHIKMSVFDPVEQECLHKASRGLSRRYYPPAKSPEEQPIIPNPSIFNTLADAQTNPLTEAGISNKDEDASLQTVPSTASCAVHLELLEAFMVLRMLVIKSGWLDKSFGVPPAKKYDASLARRRPLKWIPAVVLAVVRFEAWWSNIDSLLKTIGNAGSSTKQLTYVALPPLGKQNSALKRFGLVNTLMTTRCAHDMACIHA